MTVIAGGATAGWAVTGVKGIPMAYLAMALVLAIFAMGYTAMARHIVNAGAFYSYVAQGLGRIPGVAAAGVALVAYNAMQVGLIGGFGYVGSQTLATLFDLRESFDLDNLDTVVVGDGANDLAMIEKAGLGVAYHAKPAVSAAAGARIDHGDLTALLYAQGYKRSEFATS